MAAPASLPASGRFDGNAHRFPIRVYFEDTDLTGAVYHANYLRYMERARSDMLGLAGIDQRAAYRDSGSHYAIADLKIRYLRPASLGDELFVMSEVRNVRAASCVIAQSVWRGVDHLTVGEVTAAYLSANGRPQRQPPAWIATFNRIAAGEAPFP